MKKWRGLLRSERVLRVWEVGVRIGRVVCCAVALAVVGVLVWRLGAGIAQVRDGEITSAQMLEQLGAWLRGW